MSRQWVHYLTETILAYLKGGSMNTSVHKMTVAAAKYFKEEILDIMPDIPHEELSKMVAEYIYYQQAHVSKDLAYEVVEETCLKKCA